MQTLARYALLGSLIAGAAGTLVLLAVTLKYGIRRRIAGDGDENAAPPARVLRSIRLADTAAVLCFAVAAAFGAIGLTQQTRTLAAGARTDDGRLLERLQVLERRIWRAEADLQMRAATPEPSGWDERVTRIERRLGTVEDRAANAERLARERRDERSSAAVATTPRRSVPISAPVTRVPEPAASVIPSASPGAAAPSHRQIAREPKPQAEFRSLPAVASVSSVPPASAGPPSAAVVPPRAEATTPVAVPAPVVAPASVAAAPPTPPRDVTPSRAPAPVREPSFAEQVASGWETLKRDVQRGGDEWVEGWRRMRRVFGD